MGLQMGLGSTDFYQDASGTPPRFALLIIPPLAGTCILFFSRKGKQFINDLDTSQLTILHTIRLPIEIVLYFLFVDKAIPEIMTFEGRNWDILAGITAPFIFYFRYIKNSLSTKVVILWNVVSIGLLLNIIVLAILSAKTPFQRFGFEQPNIAVAYFPFNWLPSVVVPLVLFSHLASIKKLLTENPKK